MIKICTVVVSFKWAAGFLKANTSTRVTMNLQEWLIVVGVVIILGILIDGLRQMRLSKQDSLKMSRDLGGQIENTPIDDGFNPELPGGGVRVVMPGDDSEAPNDSPVVSEDDSQQSFSDLAVVGSDNSSISSNIEATDPQFTSHSDQDISTESGLSADSKIEPSIGLGLPVSESDADLGDGVDLVGKPRAVKAKAIPKRAKAAKKPSASKPKGEAPVSSAAHEVLVINVDARPGQTFSGAAIKGLLEACGMKHGDMSIFHRHEEGDLLSPIQFSVANAVEPGYFDPDTIETTSTPGLSFFMSVPGPKDYLKAFEFMYETAKCLADNLQGELKDENRSVLTSQTVEHCKQRIREFERKQLCKTRA